MWIILLIFRRHAGADHRLFRPACLATFGSSRKLLFVGKLGWTKHLVSFSASFRVSSLRSYGPLFPSSIGIFKFLSSKGRNSKASFHEKILLSHYVQDSRRIKFEIFAFLRLFSLSVSHFYWKRWFHWSFSLPRNIAKYNELIAKIIVFLRILIVATSEYYFLARKNLILFCW